MRIRILALSGALAASTLLAAPVMADETTPTTDPAPVVTTTPAPSQATARFRNTCRTRIAALPEAVEGKPAAFVPGAAKGLYIWHEKAGWRVRLTHPQADTPPLVEVWGRITSTRTLTSVRTVRLEDRQRGEWVRTRNRVMEFRFINGGFIDGINFRAGCSGRLGFTAWEVTRDPATGTAVRDAAGKVVRTALPIYVGSQAMPVTTTSDPALATNAPADVSRVIVLRSPVARVS